MPCSYNIRQKTIMSITVFGPVLNSEVKINSWTMTDVKQFTMVSKRFREVNSYSSWIFGLWPVMVYSLNLPQRFHWYLEPLSRPQEEVMHKQMLRYPSELFDIEGHIFLQGRLPYKDMTPFLQHNLHTLQGHKPKNRKTYNFLHMCILSFLHVCTWVSTYVYLSFLHNLCVFEFSTYMYLKSTLKEIRTNFLKTFGS